MIILDSTTKSLEVILGAGVSTELPVISNWIDITSGSQTGINDNTVTTNGITAVTSVAAPASGVTRQVKFLNVRNVNAAAVTVKFQINNNGTTRVILAAALSQDDTLTYNDGFGFVVLNGNGEQKESSILINLTTQVTGVLPVANGGTGDATLTAHGVLVGEGTSAVAVTAVGATNTVLHGNTGADPSFSAVVEADLSLSDNTTANVSTTKHGFAPKLPNDATKFLDGTGAYSAPASGTVDNAIVNGRLTLSTGVPVTTADVTAATTVYFTPYKGNYLALFDGVSTWSLISFTEISVAVPATTSTMYDVFCYNNAGTATLEALAWTNDTTRATALVLQNGVLVKSGATTRRYLGSFRTTTVSGQTEDSDAKRYLWNYYNRVPRRGKRFETTASWVYTTATWRQANAAAANQLDFIIGWDEVVYDASAAVTVGNGTAINVWLSIGLDSTSSPSADSDVVDGYTGGSSTGLRAHYVGRPGIGRHILVWLEYSVASGTSTWYANNGLSANNASGLLGWYLG